MGSDSRQINLPIKDHYHIYSNGKAVRKILFQSDDAFIKAMNLFAVNAYAHHVSILCPAMMGTHFHLIVRGKFLDCLQFMHEIRRQLIVYLRHSLGMLDEADCLFLSMDPLADEQTLKNKIIYVYRNPIEAGYSYAPHTYRWGPGDIYFTDRKRALADTFLIRDLPHVRQKQLFHTNRLLPQDWRYDSAGMIVPACYVDWQAVQSLFKTVKAFIAFLYQAKDLITEYNRQYASALIEDLAQKELQAKAVRQSKTLFGHPLSKATVDERIRLAMNLSRESPSVVMLAKILEVDPDLLHIVLNR